MRTNITSCKEQTFDIIEHCSEECYCGETDQNYVSLKIEISLDG